MWIKGCSNIKYYTSEVTREESDFKKYYCLSFEYECPYSSDRVLFAYSYPYTALDLERFFKKVLYRKINIHMKMERIKICESLSGLPIVCYIIQHKKMYKLENHSSSFLTKKNSNIKEN